MKVCDDGLTQLDTPMKKRLSIIAGALVIVAAAFYLYSVSDSGGGDVGSPDGGSGTKLEVRPPSGGSGTKHSDPPGGPELTTNAPAGGSGTKTNSPSGGSGSKGV